MSENLFGSFDIKNPNAFMRKLMNETDIVMNEDRYIVLEAELYFYSKYHPDTSSFPRSKSAGELFFHWCGADISFSSDKDSYGGVLIRSMKSVLGDKHFCGPLNCYDEIINHFVKTDDRYSFSFRLEPSDPVRTNKILQSHRIKGNQNNRFDLMPYRYLNETLTTEEFKTQYVNYRKVIEMFRLEEMKG